ncbi:DoxX family protein [Undibacterium sp. Ji67W]|uniref:DoxX family protein n=1 Tax=Undibacterium sp. Ji67W TaxID=3413042 RepID=UPI003BF15EFB
MHYFLRLHALSQRFDEQLQRWGGSLVSLGLRLFIGWQFFKAGLSKVSDWSATLSLFRDEYTVPVLPPEVAAVMGAGGELFFPVLLALGLFSRPAALGLLAVNAMAVVSYPQLFQFECPAAINDHFYWGAALLVLVVFGPGQFSIDQFLKGKRI